MVKGVMVVTAGITAIRGDGAVGGHCQYGVEGVVVLTLVVVAENMGLCQVQVFSRSKSGRILDQGGEDGRAEVGLGWE